MLKAHILKLQAKSRKMQFTNRLYLQELEEDSNSEKKPADEGNKQNLFNNPHEVYIGLQIFN